MVEPLRGYVGEGTIYCLQEKGIIVTGQLSCVHYMTSDKADKDFEEIDTRMQVGDLSFSTQSFLFSFLLPFIAVSGGWGVKIRIALNFLSAQSHS